MLAEDKILNKLIPRINELAHKSKREGLNESERFEQKKLRKKYLNRFRENFRSQLEMTQIYNKKGKEVTPKKVRRIQKNKGLRD